MKPFFKEHLLIIIVILIGISAIYYANTHVSKRYMRDTTGKIFEKIHLNK